MARGVRLIVFDFDQTLSVHHVFKTLAGWEKSKASADGLRVPQPHAISEEGQVNRIAELNGSEFREAGGFATAAFGGAQRVEEVRRHLAALQAHRVEMMICTKGLVGAVRKCLGDLDLLSYFGQVYGNVGDNYGATAYDRQVDGSSSPELRQLLGTESQGNWRSKAKLISRLMADRNLSKDEAVLVEDDPQEVMKAKNVCRTLLVKQARGMTAEHFQALEAMIAGDAASDSQEPRKGGTGGCSSPRWCQIM
eukprot:TRINITY_DN23500_c0_g1_i1.p2 TRINITY_DN23500_c0_g1~~TRINITY_DN23500_c0_g1_i1.p2  ORF type:complete len:251 (+),score=59.43 TRINITY_DN23500_c0_g1_i1:128-880(+)